MITRVVFVHAVDLGDDLSGTAFTNASADLEYSRGGRGPGIEMSHPEDSRIMTFVPMSNIKFIEEEF